MTWRRTVDSFYSDEIEEFYEQGKDKVLDESIDPRGPSFLFDVAGELGTSSNTRVLDVGSRIGKQMIELRERFGCKVVGVEPAPGNLARMRRTYPDEALTVTRALGEALPFAEGSFDLIWVRDVLVHFESLDPAFSEFRRVLSSRRSGARVRGVRHAAARTQRGRAPLGRERRRAIECG